MTDHNDAKIKMLPRCFMVLIAFYYKINTFKFEYELWGILQSICNFVTGLWKYYDAKNDWFMTSIDIWDFLPCTGVNKNVYESQ